MVKKIVSRLKGLSKKKKLFLLGVLIFVLILCIFIYFLFVKKSSPLEKDFAPDEVVTYSTGRPSEKEVKEYEVAADMPKRINLKSIQKAGYIQQVGVDQGGNIAVPTNVLMAGWYTNSVKPGDVGLSIVTGHRDGIMKKGIFRYLGDLKMGDKFEIEYGDGSIRYFEVLDIKQITVEDAYDVMYERMEGVEKQLNLITCGGTYIDEEETYDQRIVVMSKGI